MSKAFDKIKKSPKSLLTRNNADNDKKIIVSQSPSPFDSRIIDNNRSFICNEISSVNNNTEGELNESDISHDSLDAIQVKHSVEYLLKKIQKTKELLKEEQITQDENVDEYLKIAAGPNKQENVKQRNIFEKKHQKTAQNINHLVKKLDSYKKKLKEVEDHGPVTKQPKEIFRDVSQGLKNVGENIKDGIHGLSSNVLSKPRDFATLIKNHFGSADNLSNFTSYISEGNLDLKNKVHHGSATLPGTFSHARLQEIDLATISNEPSECNSSITSESGGGGLALNTAASINSPRSYVGYVTKMRKLNQLIHRSDSLRRSNGSISSRIYSPDNVTVSSDETKYKHIITRNSFQLHNLSSQSGLEAFFQELQDIREEVERIQQERDEMGKAIQKDIVCLTQIVQEEKFKIERLEEQINDLTELHQNEMENLKTSINDTEEKIQYQNEERLRDILEMLDACHAKISRLEHQQQQHQQLVTLEGIENSNARAIVVKLINVLLTVLQVILLLVATFVGIIMPFFRTR